jgi:hypothetical protein
MSVNLKNYTYRIGNSLGAMKGDAQRWSGWIEYFATVNRRISLAVMGCKPCLLHYQITARSSSQIKPAQDDLVPSGLRTFGPLLPGFKQVVQTAWMASSVHHEPFHRLYHKLQNTAAALREWNNKIIPDARLYLHMALEVILRLDLAQENRQLSPAESSLRNKLKQHIIGLAVVERARRRQNSRLTTLKLGDANTRFFHHRATSRRRKNFIQKLKKEHGWAITHEDKSLEVQSFFQSTMQRPQPRQVEINYGIFNSQRYNLSSLDMPFTEAEIKKSIDLLPADKAPGPDGFTGTFFKSCWDIIKHDVMEAVKAFHDLRCMNLQLINSANIILLPKKEGAEAVGDFRPISLIHSFVKIITKTLALRLAPHMHEIVSPCQSAFIKKRTIQDNFMA